MILQAFANYGLARRGKHSKVPPFVRKLKGIRYGGQCK